MVAVKRVVGGGDGPLKWEKEEGKPKHGGGDVAMAFERFDSISLVLIIRMLSDRGTFSRALLQLPYHLVWVGVAQLHNNCTTTEKHVRLFLKILQQYPNFLQNNKLEKF